MSWPAGTIVVCVDDSPGANFGERFLRAGFHYTIRAFFQGHIEPAVHLEEVRVPYCYNHAPLAGIEVGFRAARFRKAEGGACESERVRQMSEVRA